MGRISHFPTAELHALPTAARRVLDRRAARLGFYPNFFLTFALRPRHLVRWTHSRGFPQMVKSEIRGKAVVLDFSDVRLVGHTVVERLHDFEEAYERDGGHVQRTGIEHLQPTTDHHLASVRGVPGNWARG